LIALVAIAGAGVAAYFLFFKSAGSPSDVAKKYVRAFEQGRTDEVLGMISKKVLDRLGFDRNNKEQMKQVEAEMIKAAEGVKKEGGVTQLDTANEKIQGETATVDVTVKVGQKPATTNQVRFIKEDGQWKIDDLPNLSPTSGPSPGDSLLEGEPAPPVASVTQKASEVPDTFFRAVEAGNEAEIRRLLARSEHGEIPEILEEGTPNFKKRGGLSSVVILEEDVEGDTASLDFEVKFNDSSAQPGEMELIKEDGIWKVKRIRGSRAASQEPPPPPVATPPVTPAPPGSSPYPPTTAPSSTPTEARSVGAVQSSATKRVEPTYPPLARAARVSGTVVVEVTINTKGYVTSARALSGHPLLKEAAVAAARDWQFTPGESPVIGTLTFNFRP
jgi:TonB family protein